jgi:membrane associated rhomboid family serine protease
MNSPSAFGLPKPGPALTFVLLLVFVTSLSQALLFNAAHVTAPFLALVGDPARIVKGEVWRLLTAAILTNPEGLTDVLFTLMGLYFLTPELERRWGSRRLLAFIAGSAVFGSVVTTALDRLPFESSWLHAPQFFGAYAVISALGVAYGLEMPDTIIRLFFFIPVRSKWLPWITLGLAVLGLIYGSRVASGPFSPFAGWAVGMLFGGTPSLVRRIYLRGKLGKLGKEQSRLRSRTGKAPPLRVVYGGLTDELGIDDDKKNRDKRTLN